jgi:hypothetical protein
MPNNNKAYLIKVIGPLKTGSQDPRYSGKEIRYEIHGLDADDDRPIMVQTMKGLDNDPIWNEIRDHLKKGHLVVIYNFRYLKNYPNRIHGDAFLRHGAEYHAYDSNGDIIPQADRNVSEPLNPPGFNGLFDHPYKID